VVLARIYIKDRTIEYLIVLRNPFTRGAEDRRSGSAALTAAIGLRFTPDSSLPYTVCVQAIKGGIEVSEQPGGVGRENRRQLEEELERRTEYAKRLLNEIDRQRQEAERQGLNFTAPTAEQLKKKLASTESPMIVSQSWDVVAPGGTFTYGVEVNNPDPVRWHSLYVHVFVGLANLVRNVGDAISAVDPRFPRLTLPRFGGLSLAPEATQSVRFSITVPTSIEESNYLGNAILFQGDYHDVGSYLDRGLFVFKVA
jgi:hypothetical protein